MLHGSLRIWLSEEHEILRASATGGGGEFNRSEEAAGHIDSPVERGGKLSTGAKSILDCRGDLNVCLRIELADGGGKGGCVSALVVRAGANDGVERRRERAGDLVGLLVEGNADHENPCLRAINLPDAGERLPDAVGRVADVDHGQRIFADDFEAAGPARAAKTRPCRRLNASERRLGLRLFQPAQEQGHRDRGVVDLEGAQQRRLERTELNIAKAEIKALARCRNGFAADPDLVADKQARDAPAAIIFKDMRRKTPAILAVDDGTAGGAGIALVGDDQWQGIAEQLHMFIVDRSHAGHAAIDQADRVIAAADTRLKHGKFATALLKIEAGEGEHGFEGAESFAVMRRYPGNFDRDPRFKPFQMAVVDR